MDVQIQKAITDAGFRFLGIFRMVVLSVASQLIIIIPDKQNVVYFNLGVEFKARYWPGDFQEVMKLLNSKTIQLKN